MSERMVGVTDALGRDRVQTVNDAESMTVQSDAHMADMQTILESFGARGLQELDETALQFGDVSEFVDLQDAMNHARAAEVEFLKLPSKVREIFQHDVAVWLDTAHDKEKRDALVAAGFLKAEVVPEVEVQGPPQQAEGEPAPEGPEAGGSGGTE